MLKLEHEVRDPLYGFIRYNALERKLIDTPSFQRLRHINQLALTSFVYPGATHKRFEHCIGVMDLAGRVFDIVCKSACEDRAVCDRLGIHLKDESAKQYWRQTLRIAALLHDVGHLPFSHAAEKELLPEGWSHERLSAEVIRNSEIARILSDHRPPINPEDVVKLACDRKKRPATEQGLNEWETILNEMITGDTFGVDRVDYLLRDSLHSGVSYGRFDPLRLIDNLTIVVDPTSDLCSLAIEEGALQGAEALLLARYFMYTQVYFHHVRRAYDRHLQQFLTQWLPNGAFSTDWQEFTRLSDNEVWAGIYDCYWRPESVAHEEAARIVERRHFRRVYTWNPSEDARCPDLWDELEVELVSSFGNKVFTDRDRPTGDHRIFPVRTHNGDIVSSLSISGVLDRLPSATFGYVFADQSVFKEVDNLVQDRRRQRLKTVDVMGGGSDSDTAE